MRNYCWFFVFTVLFSCMSIASVDGVLIYNLTSGKQLVLLSQNSVGKSDEESKNDANDVVDSLILMANQAPRDTVLFAYEYPYSTFGEYLGARIGVIENTDCPQNLLFDRNLSRYKFIMMSNFSDFLKEVHMGSLLSDVLNIINTAHNADKIVLSLSARYFMALDEIIQKEKLSNDRIYQNPQGNLAGLFSRKSLAGDHFR